MMPSSVGALISAVKEAGNKLPRNLRKYVKQSYYHKRERMRGGVTRDGYREYSIMTESGTALLYIAKNGVSGEYL